MKKVLITGGAGFIGSHITDLFIEKGYEVVVIDNLKTGKKENINLACRQAGSRAKFYEVDICDLLALEKIFAQEKPDFVIHEAAHASVRESVEDPIFDAKNNILGSINLCELCVKYGIKKLVFASTGGALYGDASVVPTPENYPAHPISPYGVSKLTVENYLFYYGAMKNLNYIILRYGNVYGERQDPYGEAGVVAIFCGKIIKDEQPIINGDGKQTRDYIYVGDVARANLLAIESDKSRTAYNIGTGIETNVNKIFQTIVMASEKKVKETHGEAKSGEQKRSVLNCEKIKKELSWIPQTKLEDGLKKTYGWFFKKS